MSKVNSAVLLLIFACVSSGALGNFMLMDDTPVSMEPTPTQTVSYWFACARGGLQGYEQGMYKKTNYVVNPTCLGPQTVNDTVKIYNLYYNNNTSKDIMTIFQLIQKIAHQQRQYCEFDDVINDLFKWCDTGDVCTIDYMLQNILKKVIQITTVATNISNILNDDRVPPAITDLQYYFVRFQGIANEGGKFLRYLTDFDATKLPNN